MPGLIDAHVHLLEIHAGDKAGHLPDESLDAAFERGMANINEANCAEVTTVRDAGAYLGRNSLCVILSGSIHARLLVSLAAAIT